ncbi:hypothetical protein [Maritalea mediterranea]|uniref:CTP synthetase n=1 Tax=Maritalea mediterranea TaxID=2909667 RepID=A0ABS9E2Q1_9HYPH|nr:hypothetical protein [Maritalea mediterranea]MCF4097063.1 hypothetical protein [Maritalea mediterranea]
MSKLLGMWIISGSAVAGALVVAVLVTQMLPNMGLGIALAAILGYVLAVPFSLFLVKKVK